jgi:hypothetical protein
VIAALNVVYLRNAASACRRHAGACKTAGAVSRALIVRRRLRASG